ncbi:hypothetical protein [Cellulomonas denverensis]|uniref:Uncharacterized protein n=1 Tax=Cellulomonas denverensis TaxID=264297 RepID=A0A7X6QXP8_9CELL|nr:hypothetical protein [Cellulomonas denverensis]NKY21308.1 hypothetical protein [Cellulomonas denverensis]GIG24602.1 hypothetical protein Cde04nite_08460 [Cellulomonas denverensis]
MYAFAGPAVLAVIALWIAYLVPHKLRHRQQLLESRTEDRYSAALRVLAVSGPAGSRNRLRADVARAARPDCGSPQKRTALLNRGTGAPIGNEGRDMDRPHTTAEGMGADAARKVAQLKAAYAAATARRGAAARRRGVLAASLTVLTVAGWIVGAVSLMPLLAALIPTVLLGTVLVLGRRAVVQGEAAEVEWQHRIAEAATPVVRTARPGRMGAPGHAVRASVDATQAMPRVDQRPARTGKKVTDADGTWSPVDVPRPTYTSKPRAPHREPAPLGEVEGSTAVRPARVPSADRTVAASARAAAATGTPGTATPGTATPATATRAAAAAGAAPAGSGTTADAGRAATATDRGTAAATAEDGAAQATAQVAPQAPGTTRAPQAADATAARRVDGAADPATPVIAEEPTGSIDLDAVLARRRAVGQ